MRDFVGWAAVLGGLVVGCGSTSSDPPDESVAGAAGARADRDAGVSATTATGGASSTSGGGGGGSRDASGSGVGAAGGAAGTMPERDAAVTGSGGDGGGTPPPPVTVPAGWRGATARQITDAMLEEGYATWKMRYVQMCPNGSAGVKKDAGSMVSEGIGYGVLLANAFSDRPLFDALLRYYDEHLDQNGLMNWATGVCDGPGNNNANAATDGDLDVLMGLVRAEQRWPGGGYLGKAQALAGKMLMFEVEVCNGRTILRPGDAFGGCSDPNHDMRINPSYFAPGYYRVFAARFPDQAARWNALIDGSYELLAMFQPRMSGLVPDWANVDGTLQNGPMYWYDACRTPWRIAVDFAWTGDPRARTVLEGITGFVDSHGGLPQAAQQNNSAFTGAFALAALYDQTKFDTYVTGWLGANGDDLPYYQNTLRLLYMLVARARFPGL